ncbi:MAG: ribosomal RNA small subunit methyltransferase A [Flavobacteriales bacterium]|nr:ribosomal RNA small subunit methyltransferase A [Flavobacteriales bacterium]MCB9179774.1 ribosomal RNA small subunit methyltransferase A [Flavobacteriales bacterium]MCB9192984.1 ribosomal RNA small subunit methyltransferase A [Flavobacteriales bacterium]
MVRAKKRFGQHFLNADAIAERIAGSLTHHGGYQHVLEIGPGTGALTRHLLPRADIDLTCIELDDEAAQHLHIAFPEIKDRLITGDVLRLDLTRLGGGPLAIIGNFPYNISTQIVFQVLAHRDRVMEVIGMFQKEVADRLRAAPGSRTYGITSVLTQAYYDVEQLMIVEPGSFTPPPKVRSAVVRLQRNDTVRLNCDETRFFALVKQAFNQRRKTLHNALKGFPGLGDRMPDRFQKQRAEQLSVADFIELVNACATATDIRATGS